MTRPRADNYDDKKQLILEHAAELFGRKGFESTTMNEVAQACGASKSHVYHYFASKEDLLFGIVSEHITSQAAELTEIVGMALPAEERFARFVETFVETSADSRNEHLVLMYDLKFLPAHQRREVEMLETRLIDMMVSLLREINPALMKPREVRTPYALLIFGTIIWTFTWYRKTGGITPRELAARISEVFMQGFKAATGSRRRDEGGRPLTASRHAGGDGAVPAVGARARRAP
jgi:AcrR family transcriptional regulator